MKTKYIHIALLACLLLFAGCSPRKNTWLSRHYQAMTTHYNVYFNGTEKFKEGMDAIYASNQDDYSDVLPLYPISNKASQQIATSQMDKAIEKASKAIELHSIRKKPKFDAKRQKDPKYQAFLNKEEYNTQIDEAWILLGKSQFHKGDFLAAMGSFSYIIKHFSDNKYRVMEASIWLARSYAELGWYYDAEDVLTKLNKGFIPSSLTALFAAAQADLSLKQQKYDEAVPPLSIAAKAERMKKQKARFNFVLAQLYRRSNENQSAVKSYTKVVRANMPYVMDFNAKVNRAEANNQNSAKALHQLHRMLKSSKYKNDSDKIYYAIGCVHQANHQDDDAIKNYKLAIDKSKANVSNKIQALVALADLYYAKSKYVEAYPYYNEASTLMSPQNADYEHISKRGQLLGELSQQADIVHQQDSMQQLASLSLDARDAKIKEQIKRKQDEEIAAKKKLEEEQKRLAEADKLSQLSSADNALPTGISVSSVTSWYFYNPMLVSNGKCDFQSKWGARKLEDNWRRSDKAASLNEESEEDKLAATEKAENLDGGDANDEENENEKDNKSSISTDLKSYIDNLPLSPAQTSASNAQIAVALFRMGTIYEEDLEDIPMAIKTFEELENRFPKDKRLPDAYFLLFQMYKKKSDQSNADFYRMQLVQKFPESSYAKVLRDPDYENNIRRMNAMQDSLYASSYRAYKNGAYDSVFSNYNYIKEKYPLSSLMPKFMFINALGKGKSGNTDDFKSGLEKLVAEYPQSDVSTMSKSFLALLAQGKQVQIGDDRNSILAKRNALVKDSLAPDTLKFSDDVHEQYLLVYMVPKAINMNGLQFAVASYNFTGFLVKDFDLQVEKYNADTTFLSISALDNFDEAQWYLSGIQQDKDVSQYVDNGCRSFLISVPNYDLMRKGRTISEYQTFYNKQIKPKMKEHPASSAVPDIKAMREESMAAADSLVTRASAMYQQQTGENYDSTSVQNPNKTAETVKTKTTQIKKAEKNEKVKVKDTVSKKPIQADEKKQTKAQSVIEQIPATSVTPPKKGIFRKDEASAYYYAILVKSGNVKFESLKKAFDAYNNKHYSMANLKVEQEILAGGERIIMVGDFESSNAAKSYLFGALRQQSLFKTIKGLDYRNVVISLPNKKELASSRDFSGYLLFNKDNYLK